MLRGIRLNTVSKMVMCSLNKCPNQLNNPKPLINCFNKFNSNRSFSTNIPPEQKTMYKSFIKITNKPISSKYLNYSIVDICRISLLAPCMLKIGCILRICYEKASGFITKVCILICVLIILW